MRLCAGHLCSFCAAARGLSDGEQQSSKPNAFLNNAEIASYASLLRQFRNPKSLLEGKRVHSRILASGHDQHTFLGNLLVQMYGKCGSLGDAEAAFDKIVSKNVFSWTLMITAYVQNGHLEAALQVFRRMDLDGSKPDIFVFASILGVCAGLEDLGEGKAVHARVIGSGFDSGIVLQNALANLYSKCGSLSEAKSIFERMPQKNVVSWNAMIAAYVEHGDAQGGLKVYRQMNSQGEKVDRVTFINLVRACSALRDLKEGRAVHAHIIAWKSDSDDVLLQNALMNMYAKCGSLEDSRRVFEHMQCKNVVSWTSLIDGYAQQGHSKEAIQVYKEMGMDGVKPDAITFISVLGACMQLADANFIQGGIRESGFASGVAIGCALLNSYSRCRSIDDAKRTFDRMANRNVVSWNSMIAAYSQEGHSQEALELFRRMNLEGLKPSDVTFINILGACSDAVTVKDIDAVIVASRIDMTLSLQNALLNAWMQCGNLNDARSLFERMLTRDVVSWTSMIGAYAEHGHSRQALELLHRMDLEGMEPNCITFVHAINACCSAEERRQMHERVVRMGGCCSNDAVQNAMMNLYANCGCLERARSFFDETCWKNAVSWTSMISQYTQHGHNAEAIELYWSMQAEGVEPDECTFVSILVACSNLGDLAEGRTIHGCIVERGFDSDMDVASALVNMYAECGSLEAARSIFDRMPDKDVVTWTSMLAAHAQYGYGRQALELFEEMNLAGAEPNEITFTCILNACSHLGLLDEGRKYFVSMTGDYEVKTTVEHCRCLIDLVARSGKLDEAEQLCHDVPFKPDVVAPTMLLNACQMHGDADRGARAARACFELEPQDASPYVLLSNICAS